MLTLKIAISLVALAILTGHIIWPSLSIDAISLGLLVVALLPWASSLIESAKFPGGWEIKFRDLKKASDKIESAQGAWFKKEGVEVLEVADYIKDVQVLVSADANLALVALRIEIEKRLRTLAARHGIKESLPLTRLFRELYRQEILTESVFGSLEQIVNAGNRAAHGASVEPSVQQWALDSGTQIIAALDAVLAKPEG
jgi:hypothetical protein